MMLYDMHCHLDLIPTMERIIQDSLTQELGIIAVATTPKAYKKEIEFCKPNTNIKVALGLHPQLVAERYNEFSLFMNQIVNAKYVGEIGLDFNRHYYASKEKQIEVFTNIIKICSELGNKIISIHSVMSAQYVLDILALFNSTKNNYCILHWFTGSEKQLFRAINLGCYFSINKKMLTTETGKKIIKLIPENRLLVETDAPFIREIMCSRDLYTELEQTIKQISEQKCKDMFQIIEENSKFIIFNQNKK